LLGIRGQAICIAGEHDAADLRDPVTQHAVAVTTGCVVLPADHLPADEDGREGALDDVPDVGAQSGGRVVLLPCGLQRPGAAPPDERAPRRARVALEEIPHQRATASEAVIARAARSVFCSNIVIVIGPTPPGTGVIASATSAASSKCTSPTSRYPRFALGSSTRLMPTSMTTAPGLIMSPRIISGRPTAAMRMSACRVIAPRSCVRECATVTVASPPR